MVWDKALLLPLGLFAVRQSTLCPMLDIEATLPVRSNHHMPLYFFDTFNGKDVLSDDEGRDLPDVATARREAIEDAKELITAAIFRADDIGSGEVRVRHWAGSDPIFSIGFRDVIEGLRA